MKKPTTETAGHPCLGMAITAAILACAIYLTVRLEQEKAEKRIAVSELNEIRTTREWERREL